MSRSSGLLAGVRIVDFTFQAAGAYGAMLLAGLGAEVLKMESAAHPDPTRGRIKDRPYSHSVFFEDVNLGKTSVAVNLKHPEGVDVVRRLIEHSHAAMDNFRPGVLTRLGLDPDEFVAQRPDLVWASLSAVGADGPLAALPGYAGIFNALSGFGEMTGYIGGPPTEMRTSMDMRAGAVLAMSVVAGLVGAKRTGRGGRIDFSAAEAISMLCGDSLSEYSLAGVRPARIGNTDRTYAPHGVYACRDGWLFLAARSDAEWAGLARLLARAGVDVSAFAAREDRLARRDDLDALVEGWTSALDRGAAFDLLAAEGVPAGPAVTGADIVKDPHFTAREYVTRTRVATTERTRAVCEMPWRVDGHRPNMTEPPEFGRDTHAVLRRVLDMTDAEVDALEQTGALT